ncbi:hypothetical protein LPJ81_004665 [Coemansia sp. IMI 209127]|nr:hypothetical protein LPJ81_004665 [Coemansia sp. IMI 209127]
MLPTSVTMANAVAVAAAAAAAAASAPLPPPPSSSFNISHAQSASAMHSLVSTSLAMQKQAATMGMMFQTAAPQMQQMAPVHHHPVASVAGLGIGATLPAASFASNMVVGPLGSFTQPTAASLGQTSIMTTPSSFTSSQSIANNTAATIQGMRTIAAILPTTSVAGSSGRTMTQFRYSTPQTTQTQLQEASESMLAMTMAAGAPSVILHTQATAETMAAAVAAAAVSSNPGHANGTPIARFHPSGVQPHSALQRHGINNQTQSYSQHLPYYYTQR